MTPPALDDIRFAAYELARRELAAGQTPDGLLAVAVTESYRRRVVDHARRWVLESRRSWRTCDVQDHGRDPPLERSLRAGPGGALAEDHARPGPDGVGDDRGLSGPPGATGLAAESGAARSGDRGAVVAEAKFDPDEHPRGDGGLFVDKETTGGYSLSPDNPRKDNWQWAIKWELQNGNLKKPGSIPLSKENPYTDPDDWGIAVRWEVNQGTLDAPKTDFDDVFEKVKRAYRGKLTKQNLTTAEGWEQYSKDLQAAFDKEFGKGVLPRSVIQKAIQAEDSLTYKGERFPMKTGWDIEDYLSAVLADKLGVQRSKEPTGKKRGRLQMGKEFSASESDAQDRGAVDGLAAEEWTPYQGERGGKGWVDATTGEVRYQVEKPGEEGQPAAPTAPTVPQPPLATAVPPTSPPTEKVPDSALPAEENPQAREAASELYRRAREQGGFTYQPTLESSPARGYAVSPFRDAERVFRFENLTEDDLYNYILEMWDRFDDTRVHLGGWHDTAKGNFYLDLSVVVDSPEEAHRLSVEHKQEGYYDLERGQTVIVKSAEQRRGSLESHLGSSPAAAWRDQRAGRPPPGAGAVRETEAGQRNAAEATGRTGGLAGTIEIRVRTPDGRIVAESVPAQPTRLLGLVVCGQPEGDLVTLTHRASGCALGPAFSPARIEHLVNELEKLDLDWTQEPAALMRSLTPAVRERIAELLAEALSTGNGPEPDTLLV